MEIKTKWIIQNFQLTEVTERKRLTLFTTCKQSPKKITRGYSGWEMGKKEKERGKRKNTRRKCGIQKVIMNNTTKDHLELSKHACRTEQ